MPMPFNPKLILHVIAAAVSFPFYTTSCSRTYYLVKHIDMNTTTTTATFSFPIFFAILFFSVSWT
jgi:hypothetical protein